MSTTADPTAEIVPEHSAPKGIGPPGYTPAAFMTSRKVSTGARDIQVKGIAVWNFQQCAVQEFRCAWDESNDVACSLSESNFAFGTGKRQFFRECGEFFGATFRIEIDPCAAKLRVFEIDRL